MCGQSTCNKFGTDAPVDSAVSIGKERLIIAIIMAIVMLHVTDYNKNGAMDIPGWNVVSTAVCSGSGG